MADTMPTLQERLVEVNLALLRQMRDDLEAQIAAEDRSPLLSNTYVAFFEGR